MLRKPSGINIYKTGLKLKTDHQQVQQRDLKKKKLKIRIYLKNTKPAH